MTKVSTNAGKNPYSRTDFISPVVIQKGNTGIRIDPTVIPKFKVEVDTEFKDKKGKIISFKDLVTYEKEQYEVGYDGKEFRWIITHLNNPKKAFILSKVHKSLILFKKYNKML